jgi:hypothetical protein
MLERGKKTKTKQMELEKSDEGPFGEFAVDNAHTHTHTHTMAAFAPMSHMSSYIIVPCILCPTSFIPSFAGLSPIIPASFFVSNYYFPNPHTAPLIRFLFS